MTERTSFFRKLIYLGGIIVLAFFIYWLSVPATTTREGGVLAQKRKEYNLSQVNLGEVDPASETIKLATLGLRGVAVNLLWEQANEYKKKEDWTNLTATLEQLAKLQPNFITFWKFQAWNLTYNVSVEFDDYHDRYYYVRRGIEFLQKGEQYNIDNPALLWDLGWFIGQKIGRADEHVQYRRLFKDDEDFHPPARSYEDRDNWLVGKEWYEKAIAAVDERGKSLGRKSPRDFYSSPAKSQMNYAEAIEEDGAFERARLAWIKAQKLWEDFGLVPIQHSTGVELRLGTQPQLEKELAEKRAKLDALLPGTRDKLAAEKKSALTAEERAIVDTRPELLTPEQGGKLYEIQNRLTVSDREVGERVARDVPAKANEAMELASAIQKQDIELQYTINYKHDANFDYWLTRAKFEQTPNAMNARELMYRAKKEIRNSLVAKKLYDEGFAKWRLVIDEFPTILSDDATTGDDILEFILEYRKYVLDPLDERIDADFPLWDVIEKFDKEQDFVEELKEHRGEKPTEPVIPGMTIPGVTPAAPGATEAPAEPAAPSPAASQPVEPTTPPATETPAEVAPPPAAIPAEAPSIPPAEAAPSPTTPAPPSPPVETPKDDSTVK